MTASRTVQFTLSKPSATVVRCIGRSRPSASVNTLASRSRSQVWNREKSTGSGELEKHAPKVSGCESCSHSEPQPPLEWPVTMRASRRGTSRNSRSSAGISSVTSAVPHGPFAGLSTKPWCASGDSGSSVTCTAGAMTPAVAGSARSFAIRAASVQRAPNHGTMYTAGKIRRRWFGSSHPGGSATPARSFTSRPAAAERSSLRISNQRRLGSDGRGSASMRVDSSRSSWSGAPRRKVAVASALSRFPGARCPRSSRLRRNSAWTRKVPSSASSGTGKDSDAASMRTARPGTSSSTATLNIGCGRS